MLSAVQKSCLALVCLTASAAFATAQQIPSELYAPQHPIPPFPYPPVLTNVPNVGFVNFNDDPLNASAPFAEVVQRSQHAIGTLHATNTRPLTLGGQTATFPIMAVPPPPMTPISAKFESMDQLDAMAPDFMHDFFVSEGLMDKWTSAMVDPDVAEDTFFGSLANEANKEGNAAYNLLILRRIKTKQELTDFLAKFCASADCAEVGGRYAVDRWEKLIALKGLYVIDLSMLSNIAPGSPVGQTLYAPGMMMILERSDVWDMTNNPWAHFAEVYLADEQPADRMHANTAWRRWFEARMEKTKSFVQGSDSERPMQIKPVAVRLASFQEASVRHYTRATCTPTAWALAIYAARPAITTWGITVGHILYWHVLPGAVVRGMFNHIAPQHPLHELMRPFSEYVAGWNTLLFGAFASIPALNITGIGPPTPVASTAELLTLLNIEGATRLPLTELDPRSVAADLGVEGRWVDEQRNRVFEWENLQIYTELWDVAYEYCRAVVDLTYPDDAAVSADVQVQAWAAALRDTADLNMPDVGEVRTRGQLAHLISFVKYSALTHGVARLWMFYGGDAAAMPAASPTCLMTGELPDAAKDYTEAELLAEWVPDMDVMREWTMFSTIFTLAPPSVRLIPEGGVEAELDFEGGAESPKNQALIQHREKMVAFLRRLIQDKGYCDTGDATTTEACILQQISQFPANIEM